MPTTFPLTLAFNEVELILGAIGVIILFGNWIVRRLKEGKADQQQDQAARSESGLTLEEMAKRRREQLRSLSRTDQTGGEAPTQASSSHQPKSLYDRRAEALRRARQQSGEQPASLAQELDADRRREAQVRQSDQQEMQRRARAEAEAKRRREAQQEQQRQRQAAEHRRRMQQVAERERQQEAARRRAASGRQQTLGRVPIARTSESETRRLVEDADSSAYDLRKGKRERPGWIGEALSTRESLKRAIVLAEVLGKPVSLREPDEAVV